MPGYERLIHNIYLLLSDLVVFSRGIFEKASGIVNN